MVALKDLYWLAGMRELAETLIRTGKKKWSL